MAAMLICWCLIAVVVIGCVNIYIRSKIKQAFPYEKIILIGTLFLNIDALHALVARSLFPTADFYDWGAPYGLLYGPLIYFALQLYSSPAYIRKRMALSAHLLPFMVYFGLYLICVFQRDYQNFPYALIKQTRYPAIIISICFYTGLNAYHYRKKNMDSIPMHGLFTSVSLFLLLTALLIFATTLVDHKTLSLYEIPRLILYFLMLCANCAILDYYVKRLTQFPAELPKEPAKKDKAMLTVPYQKSGVSDEDLRQYSEILKTLMEKQQFYLDPTFNLSKLAILSGIPKHQLSQVFNTHLGTSFTDFINQKRIEYALHKINDPTTKLSMEQLAFKSGFNSKVSFYRHFKAFTGFTPSAYKQQKNA